MPLKRLAVIADPVKDALSKGLSRSLGEYFNPAGFFDEVFLISPVENVRQKRPGFEVIPAKDVELPGLLRQLNIDVVRAYGGRWPLEMAVFSRARNVPVVVSIHDRRPHMLYDSVKWADIVLCVSEQVRKQVLKHYSCPERVWLRPNGVDLSRMQPIDQQQWAELDQRYPFERVILHVGRKSPEKNIDLLIRALKYLPAGFGLVMVGHGEDSVLRRLAEELRVAARCVFIETVENEQMPLFYSWADCFCLPSFDEAMSNVVLEAMACACPMVLSGAAAAGVGVENGQEALIIDDLYAPEVLAREIKQVIDDPVLSGRMKDNARLKVARFDQKITSKMEADQYRLIMEMRDAGLLAEASWHFAARKADHFQKRLMRKFSRITGL